MHRCPRFSVGLAVIVLIGCSSGGSTTSTTGTGHETSPARTDTPAETSAATPADVPVVGGAAVVALRIARDVLPSGAARGIGVDVEPTAPKVVAVVDAGGWQGSGATTLTFKWSAVDASSHEAALFEQHVDVTPG